MKNRSNYIDLIEKYAIILLAYSFKAVRFLIRLLYKVLRFLYRILKAGFIYCYKKLEPHYQKAQEKIYVIACNTFDLK